MWQLQRVAVAEKLKKKKKSHGLNTTNDDGHDTKTAKLLHLIT